MKRESDLDGRRRATLAEWAAKQNWRLEYRSQTGARWAHPDTAVAAVIPDVSLQDRSEAWTLEDYLVSSVAGGSIWFRKREGGAAWA